MRGTHGGFSRSRVRVFHHICTRKGRSKRFSVSGVSLITSVARCYVGKLRMPFVCKELNRNVGIRSDGPLITGIICNTLNGSNLGLWVECSWWASCWLGGGRVKLLANGATLMANTTHNVNGTITVGFTSRNTGVTFASLMLGSSVTTNLRTAHGRVRTLNMAYHTCTNGTTSFRRARGAIGRVRTSFNSVSVLIGGTNVAGSNLVLHVDRTR